jgi:hypothetical protein
MKHNSYYPGSLGAQLVWLAKFINRLPDNAAALGLTPAQVAAILADCLWLLYVLQTWLPAVRSFNLAGTNAVTAAQTGEGADPQVLPVFTPPVLPAKVAAVLPGALLRLFAAIQLIKDSGKCTDTIAADLGIVGTAQPGPDYTTIQPVIEAYIQGAQVFIKWGWGGFSAFLDACEIWVDRGDGKGFVFLTIDPTPGYTDTQPFPAASVKWTYKATYRLDDKQVGLWSQTTSVTVPA